MLGLAGMIGARRAGAVDGAAARAVRPPRLVPPPCSTSPEPRLVDLRADHDLDRGRRALRPGVGFGRAGLGARFGALAVGVGLLGPIGFVRRYVQRFAALGRARVARLPDLVDARRRDLARSGRPTDGGLPFWPGVDLVIAIAGSWRRSPRTTRASRATGRTAFWRLRPRLLRAHALVLRPRRLLVLARSIATPEEIPAAVLAGSVGILALLALTVDESDEAFADIYSTAVSIQNVLPRVLSGC